MIKVSNGNKKIGNDTLIINICSATDCPSREKGLCKVADRCYAMKAERCYPQVLPYRRYQETYWDLNNPKKIAEDLVKIIKNKKNKINYVRFSEAGDFRGQDDVWKMKELAKAIPNVIFYGYTARNDLVYDDIPDNMVVNGSGFMISNSFTAVPEILEGDTSCPGDCRKCDLCKHAQGHNIKVLYH